MLRFGVVALTLAVFSSNAFAYPIFYACSADGRLREFVNTKELETLVLSSTDEEVMNKRLKVLCGGIYECFAVLKQALMLTKANIQINNQILEAEVRALVEKKGAELNQSIDPALPTTARNLMEMAQDIQACRKAQEDLPEDSFRLYDPRFGNPKYGDGGLILQN